MSTKDPNIIEVTAEGLAELKEELKKLLEIELPETIDRVAKAREHGDLSENAEYTDAKEHQRFLETRISELEDVIARATVVKKTRSHTIIGVGSKVTVLKTGAKKPLKIQIVGEFEADPLEHKISSASPLGKALIGKKKGDKTIVHAPAGEIEYTVQDIE